MGGFCVICQELTACLIWEWKFIPIPEPPAWTLQWIITLLLTPSWLLGGCLGRRKGGEELGCQENEADPSLVLEWKWEQMTTNRTEAQQQIRQNFLHFSLIWVSSSRNLSKGWGREWAGFRLEREGELRKLDERKRKVMMGWKIKSAGGNVFCGLGGIYANYV